MTPNQQQTADDEAVLDLMRQVGIRATKLSVGPADTMTVLFDSDDDLDAVLELTARSTQHEFGCDWQPAGRNTRVVPRRDLPALATLLHREIEGQFAHTPHEVLMLRVARMIQWLLGLSLMVIAISVVFAPRLYDWIDALITVLFMVGFVGCERVKDLVVRPRRHLDRVKAAQ